MTLQEKLNNLKANFEKSAPKEAIEIAFTEVITGRAPEKRGNGLKYVRRNIEKGYFELTFQTDNVELFLGAGEIFSDQKIHEVDENLRGCLAFIKF